jgi:hypothetical protein
MDVGEWVMLEVIQSARQELRQYGKGHQRDSNEDWRGARKTLTLRKRGAKEKGDQLNAMQEKEGLKLTHRNCLATIGQGAMASANMQKPVDIATVGLKGAVGSQQHWQQL